MIHRYIFRDTPIVLDVNSGAVHVVDPVIYDALEYCNGRSVNEAEITSALADRYEPAEISDAISDIKELIAADMLFSEDEVDKDSIERKEPVIKAMCLHVAHDCNMNCAYCFGDKGAFEGIRCLLSLETGKKAIDFLIQHSGSRRNLEIDFFGGEPLMNFDVVKELVKYGREIEGRYGKNIRFTITTNGILLDDDKIAYINHDIEDAIRGGVLRQEDLPKGPIEVLGKSKSERITTLIKSIIANSTDLIQYDEATRQAHDELRKFMFARVYTNPVAKGEESKAKDIIRRLYEYYSKNPMKLPADFIPQLDFDGMDRIVCDYIAGMTDRYAVYKFSELFIPATWQVR